jgi:hypothetical protein
MLEDLKLHTERQKYLLIDNDEFIGIEIVEPINPILIPELNYYDIAKHAEHDQSSHGNWAKGGSQRGANIDENAMYAAYEKAGLTVEKISRTSNERQAFESYLTAGHFINQKIRQTSPENLNQEFTVNEQTYPANLIRDIDNLIDSAPNLKGDRLYRTTSAETVERLKVGDVIQDKGYMSSTTADLLSPDNGILLLTLSKVSSGRKSIIRIDSNDNQKGLFMSAVSKSNPIASFEREVVLPRNTKLRFKGIAVLPLSNERGLKIYDFERLP